MSIVTDFVMLRNTHQRLTNRNIILNCELSRVYICISTEVKYINLLAIPTPKWLSVLTQFSCPGSKIKTNLKIII